jgi:hypothetical protein
MGPRCFGRQRANEGRFYVMPDGLSLCPWCHERVKADILALPRDYLDLTLRARVRMRARSSEIRPASRLSYIPMDEYAEATYRCIFWTLTCWEQVVRDRSGLADVDYSGMRPGRVVDLCARVIAHRLQVLAGAPPVWGYFDGADQEPADRSGMDAIDDLRRLHRRAMVILDLSDPITHMPGPCPGCGRAALRRRAESDFVHCADCNHRIPHEDYPLIILEQLGVKLDQ